MQKTFTLFLVNLTERNDTYSDSNLRIWHKSCDFCFNAKKYKKLTCEDWICCAIAFYKISLHQQDRQQIKTR